MQKSRFSVLHICFVAIFVAIIAALTQVTIPMPLGVPFSLQTFAVALTGVALGPKYGALAALVYLALGTVGAPVFAGMGGGFHRIVGPWGGYLLSYPLVAALVGWGAEKDRIWLRIVTLTGGVIVNLGMGMAQLAFINNYTLRVAFLAGVAPFILVELIKMTGVFFLTTPVRKILQRFS